MELTGLERLEALKKKIRDVKGYLVKDEVVASLEVFGSNNPCILVFNPNSTNPEVHKAIYRQSMYQTDFNGRKELIEIHFMEAAPACVVKDTVTFWSVKMEDYDITWAVKFSAVVETKTSVASHVRGRGKYVPKITGAVRTNSSGHHEVYDGSRWRRL